ncbi:hypothetical protein ACFQE8_16715 [Salinirubellus sp. GCM10025818]|jgi:hypothetical protein|uniref:DUF7550 family protein n=1 Tax=Salinirubellus TaxID=2162630 RepID=UPI0030CAB3E4
MADHTDEDPAERAKGHEVKEGHTYADPHEEAERSTAPQSPYTDREVGIGAAIALAGMVLVFLVPILLT